MTFFGKILVMLNLALSLLLVTWALGVYTNSTDWASKEGPPEKVKGEVHRLQYQAGERWKSVVAAEASWKKEAGVVRLYEYIRPENDRWFAQQLKDLDVGSKKPVLSVIWKSGEIVPDPKQAALSPRLPARPLLEPAKDKFDKELTSLDLYKKDFADKQALITVEMKKYQDLTKEDTKLTLELGGDKQLRHRQEFETARQELVREEIEHLKPLLVDSKVQGELLVKRRASLEQRVRQLEALGLTAARE